MNNGYLQHGIKSSMCVYGRVCMACVCVWPVCVWPVCVWPVCVWPCVLWPAVGSFLMYQEF